MGDTLTLQTEYTVKKEDYVKDFVYQLPNVKDTLFSIESLKDVIECASGEEFDYDTVKKGAEEVGYVYNDYVALKENLTWWKRWLEPYVDRELFLYGSVRYDTT